MTSKSLLRRTMRWAWQRDEVDQQTTKETVRYTVTMYVVALALIIAAGVLLSRFGYTAVAFSLLLFGIWFTTFVGVVNIGWEWLRYRYEARQEERPPDRSGPQRELAPDIELAADTKIGFVVTVLAILSLIVSFQLALFLLVRL